MERLTDCAKGYCEMYCKKYMLCFEDPEDCTFKDEIKLYDAIKSIEGVVPFERLLELACADKAGRLVVLPCGNDVELVRDGHSFKADHWNHTLTAFRDAPENKSGKQVALFSIEEAEAAMKGGDLPENRTDRR